MSTPQTQLLPPPQSTPEEKTVPLDEAVERLRAHFRVPKKVVERMLIQESGANPYVGDSPEGAEGMFQVMPSTLELVARKSGKKLSRDNPLHNAYAGLWLLRDNYDAVRQKAKSERHAWMMAVAGYHGPLERVLEDLEAGGTGIPDQGDGLINTRDHVYNIFSNTQQEDFAPEVPKEKPSLRSMTDAIVDAALTPISREQKQEAEDFLRQTASTPSPEAAPEATPEDLGEPVRIDVSSSTTSPGEAQAIAHQHSKFSGGVLRIELSPEDTQETLRARALDQAAQLAGLERGAAQEFRERMIRAFSGQPLLSPEEFEQKKAQGFVNIQLDEATSPEVVGMLRSYQSGGEVHQAQMLSQMQREGPELDVRDRAVDAAAFGAKGAMRALEPVGNTVSAFDTYIWAKAAGLSDQQAAAEAALAIQGQPTPYSNPGGDLLARLPYLRNNPRWREGFAQFIGGLAQPSTLVPLPVGKGIGKAVTKAAQGEGRAAGAARAMRDAGLYTPDVPGVHKAADDPSQLGSLARRLDTPDELLAQQIDEVEVPITTPSSVRVVKPVPKVGEKVTHKFSTISGDTVVGTNKSGTKMYVAGEDGRVHQVPAAKAQADAPISSVEPPTQSEIEVPEFAAARRLPDGTIQRGDSHAALNQLPPDEYIRQLANTEYSHLLDENGFVTPDGTFISLNQLNEAGGDFGKAAELAKAPSIKGEVIDASAVIKQTPSVEPAAAPSAKFASNKFFTQEKVDAADKAIQDFLNPERLHDIQDIYSILPHLIVKGGAIIEKGVRDFADWAGEFLTGLSEESHRLIEPHLRDIYQRSLARVDMHSWAEEELPYNIDKYRLPTHAKEAMARTIHTLIDEGRVNKERISKEELLEEVKTLDPSLVPQLRKNLEAQREYAALIVAARETSRSLAQEVAEKSRSLYDDFENGRITEQEFELRQQEIDFLEHENRELQNVILPLTSWQGRNLAYNRRLASEVSDEKFWVQRARNAARKSGTDTSTEEWGIVEKDIRRQVERKKKAKAEYEILRAEVEKTIHQVSNRPIKVSPAQKKDLLEKEEKARRHLDKEERDLAKKMAELEKTHWLTALSRMGLANMLSSVPGALTDITSTTLNLPFEAISSIPATAFDMLYASTRGRRSVSLSATPGYFLTGARGFKEGVKELPHIARHGLSERELQQMEIPHLQPSGHKLVDALVDKVGKFRSMIDEVPFRTALEIRLRERSYIEALNQVEEGKLPRALVKTEAERIYHSLRPHDIDSPLVMDASFAAQMDTFRQENLVTKAVGRGRSVLGPGGNFVLDLFLPFARSMTNWTTVAANYAGGPATMTLQGMRALIKRNFTLQEQRAMALKFGRGATGTGLWLLGYMLAGYIIPAASSPEEHQQLVQRGLRGGTFYNPITETYDDLAILGPVAVPLQVGAAYRRRANLYVRQSSKRNPLSTFGGRVLSAFSSAPIIRAGRDITRSLEDPTKIDEVVGRLIRRFIPLSGLLGNISDAVEDQVLDDRAKRDFGWGVVAPAVETLPGGSKLAPELLPPRRPQPKHFDSPVREALNAFNPLRSTPARRLPPPPIK